MQACVKNSVQRGGSVCQGDVCAGVSSKGGVCIQGGGGGCRGLEDPPSTMGYGQQAGGTHPT